jgi:membrane-associated phospholipid phosphatase
MLMGLAFLLILLSSFSFYFVDESLCRLVTTPTLDFWQTFSNRWTHLADAKWYFIFSILILIGSGVHYVVRHRYFVSYKKFKSLYNFGYQMFISLLASGLIVHFFKFLIGRKRPYHVMDSSQLGLCLPFVFDPLTTDYNFHSMPSGHSQLIFTVVTFLSFYIGSMYVKFGLFLFAFVIALTRIGTQDHFLSDVLIGSGVGIIVTNLVMRKLFLKNS